MNTFFTNRLNGIFILNTLLELPQPVTVSMLTAIINERYFHVTAPQSMVSTDTVRRYLLPQLSRHPRCLDCPEVFLPSAKNKKRPSSMAAMILP